jgi:phenylalanyl-tRNA synthetase beta chain
MKISLNQLKKFITFKKETKSLADNLTMIGLEVEGIEINTPPFSKVIISELQEVSQHPNAEKLSVVQVFDGTERRQVVCGDPKCKKGMKVAFAQHGAKLTDETGKVLKIKKGKLRGVESMGMLCSGKELQLSDDDSGIISLSSELKIGTELASLYEDTILDISLTPNLNYCSSLMGVARELSSLLEIPYTIPEMNYKESSTLATSDHITINIDSTEECPKYACRLIKGVTIKPSPQWLQTTLKDMGFRPVNNVVDITNLVLIELGHPLHAFDFDTISEGKICIGKSVPKEELKTLDGVIRTIPENTLMIRDGKKAIAIAGIMGGSNTEVSDHTQNILLEAAYFSPSTIRKGSKQVNIQTESSKRFERGTDPNLIETALDRASYLIQQLAGGECGEKSITMSSSHFPPLVITCRLFRVNALLGLQLSLSEIDAIFKRLHFDTKSLPNNILEVTIPTFRIDISKEIDLVEEVARIYGYHNIPRTFSSYKTGAIDHSPLYVFENTIREKSLNQNLQEFITCDMISPQQVDLITSETLPESSFIKVLNPTSIEQSVMRPSLLPSLLQVIQVNQDRHSFNISGFEIGNTHLKDQDRIYERSTLGIILSGKIRKDHWAKKPESIDFYDLKGLLENILTSLSIQNTHFQKSALHFFHPGRQSTVSFNGAELGVLGEVHPSLSRHYNLKQRVYFAEINLLELQRQLPDLPKMQEISIYPSSTRDWTVTLSSDIEVGSVVKKLEQIPSKLLEKISVKDLYSSPELGEKKRNITFHFIYRDLKKTISYDTVEAEHKRLTKIISEQIENA